LALDGLVEGVDEREHDAARARASLDPFIESLLAKKSETQVKETRMLLSHRSSLPSSRSKALSCSSEASQQRDLGKAVRSSPALASSSSTENCLCAT
jgi:hypothetical protein